jgi:AraC-like DNA-binding protein
MIIDSSIDNDHLSIEELGKKMGMSRTYLYRKIKKLTNMSVSEFIITVKLKKSLELLRNSGKTVAEIAFEVGFTSASYYTRCFKDVFMMTPSEYIKKNKKTNEI